MTKTRSDSFSLFILGCVIFVGLGIVCERISAASMVDFNALYYGARCLVQHSDPYQEGNLLSISQSMEPDRPSDAAVRSHIFTVCINLPSALVLVIPFALFPLGLAQLAWMALTGACFILAAFLMWDIGAQTAPRISGVLACLFLCGSELLLEVGNSSGVAVGLCIVAVCCFLRERFAWAGVVCFALSLLIKPHVTGPILLFFLLAGGMKRKRGLQILALALASGILAVIFVWHIAPHWFAELNANVQTLSARGQLNDPGPTSLDTRAHGAPLISLQTVLSLVKDDAQFYNPASWLICAPFLIIWAVTVLRRKISEKSAWLALAAMAALSMLPIYHRQHDTRLLLLTIPAMAVVWSAGGAMARIGLLLTTMCALLTGDLAEEFLAIAASSLRLAAHGFFGKVLSLMMTRPVPLIVFAVGVFYLWAYVRYPSAPEDRNRAAHIDKLKQSGEALSHD
jgi:hypothetical protein